MLCQPHTFIYACFFIYESWHQLTPNIGVRWLGGGLSQCSGWGGARIYSMPLTCPQYFLEFRREFHPHLLLKPRLAVINMGSPNSQHLLTPVSTLIESVVFLRCFMHTPSHRHHLRWRSVANKHATAIWTYNARCWLHRAPVLIHRNSYHGNASACLRARQRDSVLPR